MKLSMRELTDGMQGALNKVKGVVSNVLPGNGAQDADEKRKNMLGSGMAANAAQNIINRKKAIDDVMGN